MKEPIDELGYSAGARWHTYWDILRKNDWLYVCIKSNGIWTNKK